MNKESTPLENTTLRGQRSEQRVALDLQTKGWTLLANNFRWRGGEIDLVFQDPQGVLVFVEVRSSTEESPWLKYSLGMHKRRRLWKTAERFLFAHPRFKRGAHRFDVVWVQGDRLEHWKNVWLEG